MPSADCRLPTPPIFSLSKLFTLDPNLLARLTYLFIFVGSEKKKKVN